MDLYFSEKDLLFIPRYFRLKVVIGIILAILCSKLLGIFMGIHSRAFEMGIFVILGVGLVIMSTGVIYENYKRKKTGLTQFLSIGKYRLVLSENRYIYSQFSNLIVTAFGTLLSFIPLFPSFL